MTEVITALDHCVRSQEQMVETERSFGTSTDTFDLDLKTLFKDVSLEQIEPLRTQKPSRPPIDNRMKKTLLIGSAVLGVMILLRRLECCFRQRTARRIDLSLLNGMKIRFLKTVLGTVNLSEVKGLPLSELACFGSNITNTTLIPISGMPLHGLAVTGNWGLTSLDPLKGMPLTFLLCDNSQVADLSPLRGMPLKVVVCDVTKVADLSPLKGMPLEQRKLDRPGYTRFVGLAGADENLITVSNGSNGRMTSGSGSTNRGARDRL